MFEFKPRRPAGANLQAELYWACKKKGICCFLEYESKWNDQYGCRFDAVIHNDREIYAIVEVKGPRNTEDDKHQAAIRKQRWLGTKQKRKYEQFGVPVLLLTCLEEIPEIVNKLESLGTGGGNLRRGVVGDGGLRS